MTIYFLLTFIDITSFAMFLNLNDMTMKFVLLALKESMDATHQAATTQAASMPVSSLPPPSQLPSQLTSPGQPLPPPVTGFVASGTPSKVGLSCASRVRIHVF